jgi:hypothetical protein
MLTTIFVWSIQIWMLGPHVHWVQKQTWRLFITYSETSGPLNVVSKALLESLPPFSLVCHHSAPRFLFVKHNCLEPCALFASAS